MSQFNPDEQMGGRIFGQEYDLLQEGLKKLRERVVEKQAGVKDARAQLGIGASGFNDLDEILQALDDMISHFEKVGYNRFRREFQVSSITRRILTLLKTAAALQVQEYEKEKEKFLKSDNPAKNDLLFDVEQKLQERQAILNGDNLKGVEPDTRFIK